jgi:hypothetical protein
MFTCSSPGTFKASRLPGAPRCSCMLLPAVPESSLHFCRRGDCVAAWGGRPTLCGLISRWQAHMPARVELVHCESGRVHQPLTPREGRAARAWRQSIGHLLLQLLQPDAVVVIYRVRHTPQQRQQSGGVGCAQRVRGCVATCVRAWAASAKRCVCMAGLCRRLRHRLALRAAGPLMVAGQLPY